MPAASDQSMMRQFGAQLVDNGFSIIPIKPSDKAPGDYVDGSWRGLSRWQDFCTRLPTDAEVARWEQYPDAGIGFPTGRIVGIDIDVKDSSLAHRVAELARLRLGDTPALRIGEAPKQLLVYRAETPFASFDAKPLQVLALGRQFVGYGIHPVTQKHYTWPIAGMTELDFESLPVVTEQQVRSWMAEAVKILPASMRSEPPRPVEAGPQGEHEPATYEAVESALRYVPSDSGTSRPAWIEIGMAIKAGLGEEGIHLWHEWSARDGTRYSSKECDTQWKSFRDVSNGVGVGTLFERAKNFGWHPEPGIFLYAREKETAADVKIDFQALVANIMARQGGVRHEEPEPEPEAQKPKYTVPQGEPGWLRDLDGGLRMFVDYARSQSHRDQPLLALAVSLPTFGTLAGRRYKTETGLLSNVYTVGIGGSASGKEMGINVATRLFNAAGLTHMLGGEEIASGRAIISTLREKPACFFALDEFGKMLSRVTNPRSRSANDADIFKVLLSMFSASQRVYGGVEYADKTVKKTEPICNPCLSIYGPTTGSTFWGSLSSGEAIDGSLARMLVFESENSYPPQRRVYQRDMPEELIEFAKKIAGGVEGHNTFPLGDGFAAAPNPYPVRLTPQAAERDDELMAYQDQLLREHEGTAGESIYGRMREVILKVALIRAVTSSEKRPVITLQYFDWSAELVLDRVAHMIKAMRFNLADNEQEAFTKKIYRLIADCGKNGISKNDLTRRSQWLDARRREGILATLLEGNDIRAESFTLQSGNKRVVYFGC